MKVRAVRQGSKPPPIEKVVVELGVEEAHAFITGVDLTNHLYEWWVFAEVARQIKETLDS